MAAFDQIDLLVKIAQCALSGAPTPAFPPFAIARSVIDATAEIAWLLEAKGNATARLARGLTVARYEIWSRTELNLSVPKDALPTVEKDATQFGLSLVGDFPSAGYGVKKPSHGSLARKVVPKEDWRIYSYLSAAAHGEQWAIIKIGYLIQSTDANGFVTLTKSPTFDSFHEAIHAAYEAFGRAIWADCRFIETSTETAKAILDAANSIEQFKKKFW
ncbi:MAG: hypothetical protein WCL53_01645 [Chloroflexota bacterium]